MLHTKIIATSNLTNTSDKFQFVLDYSKWIDVGALFVDNPLLMMLKVLSESQVRKVALAGFDGYSCNSLPNYYNPHMEYIFNNEQAIALNDYVKRKIRALSTNMDISFITKSYYI